MLNPFFLNGSKTEQSLIQDLVNEQLKMYGVEIFYLPRTYVTKNTVIKEVIQSEFNDAYPIEAYVDSYEGYGGQGTILSKFGIQNLDDLTLIISRERYENYIAPLIRDQPNIELTARPKEGDLIYFPLGDRIFEIKYVEHEQPFYQLNKNYVYQLRCELFRYEDEVLDTGIDEIDDDISQIGYIQTLTLIGSGVTASATASYCASGSVRKIYITNMGGSYTSQPTIGISSAPSGGITAVGIASITTNYVNCNGQNGGKIQAINLINAGCGYTVAPWVTIQGGGGVGAAATAGITTGSVGVVTVTSGVLDILLLQLSHSVHQVDLELLLKVYQQLVLLVLLRQFILLIVELVILLLQPLQFLVQLDLQVQLELVHLLLMKLLRDKLLVSRLE
jgi:hypothetical protein